MFVNCTRLLEIGAKLARAKPKDFLHNKSRSMVRYRAACAYLMRQHAGMSYPEIARVFERKDHTGIMDLLRVHGPKVDDYVRPIVEELEKLLGQRATRERTTSKQRAAA